MTFFNRLLFAISLLTVITFQSCDNSTDSEEEIIPQEQKLLNYSTKSSFTTNQLQLIAQFGGLPDVVPLIESGFTSYAVTYQTTDKDGQSIEASGVVSFPTSSNEFDWIILNRGTILSDEAAPSTSSDPTYEIAAALGYAVVIPDLVGFGSTKDLDQYYFINNKTGEHSYDLLLAAKELAKELEVSNTNNCILAGYSQGGYSTLATAKYLSDNSNDLNITSIHAGAGGYNLVQVMNEVLQSESYDSPSFLALITHSYFRYYNWDMELIDIFQPEVASNIEITLDGSESISSANTLLPNSLSELFNTTFLTDLKSQNKSHPMYIALENNSVDNIMVDAPIYLYHSDLDEIIPPITTSNTIQKLKENNNEVIFMDIEGDNHGEASIYMLISAFETLSGTQIQ